MISARTALAALTVIAASAPAHADVVISTAPTQNMSCTAGVCAPTASDAVLNVTDLENDLSEFGNVKVLTTGNGVEANNIDIQNGFSWSNANRLALDAYLSIEVARVVRVSGTGGLSLTTNDGGSGGTLSFRRKGRVTFRHLSSKLWINGQPYMLADTIDALGRDIASRSDGRYALANDYDARMDGARSRSPISTTLNGTLEGLGNTISNLLILAGSRKRAAFLNEVGTTGVVENLRLYNLRYATARSNANPAGGLIGLNQGYLFGDEVTGSIASGGNSGGLVGYNEGGSIVSSSADVFVKGTGSEAGGLVGENDGGYVGLSHAQGLVEGHEGVGGLVGQDCGGYVDQDYATGNVAGSGQTYGRLGGLVGLSTYDEVCSGAGDFVEDSYSTGSVSGGTGFGGGLIGEVEYSYADTSYATGVVKSSDGGFVCTNAVGDYTDDYWDTTTSGASNGACNANSSGITGLTTEQLQSGLPTGFDPAIWAEKPHINNGLPYLINNPPPK